MQSRRSHTAALDFVPVAGGRDGFPFGAPTTQHQIRVADFHIATVAATRRSGPN